MNAYFHVHVSIYVYIGKGCMCMQMCVRVFTQKERHVLGPLRRRQTAGPDDVDPGHADSGVVDVLHPALPGKLRRLLYLSVYLYVYVHNCAHI